ncbi:MAG: class I SAM-dependent methyltransferase [Spirochaetales bacterium]|nr:class I SAM-dependent methyltransferase [Spirochaetales bacterium]
MCDYLFKMKEYWDKRFKDGSSIWGKNPSSSTRHALTIFNRRNVHTLLIPGSGYGRNSKLFSTAGLRVVGVEISDTAFNLAKEFDPHSKFYNMSVLDIERISEMFDAVYCFNVLHLFRQTERRQFIKSCALKINDGGILYFVVFSEQEKNYGKGEEVEQNTFESKPGRPVHYFSENDLMKHFSAYKLIETGLVEDSEDHGEEGEHTHILRYIVCAVSKKDKAE